MQGLTLLAVGLIMVTVFGAADVFAQRPTQGKPPIEFSVTYGSMWGGNIDTYKGKLRTGTGPSIGFALDIPVHPTMAVELSYTRQEGSLDWDNRNGIQTLSDMSVNFWQIGAVRGLMTGKVRPFITMGLGATYFSPSASSLTFDEGTPDEETFNISTQTKFSLMLGVGFKTYFGKSEKIGLRASIKTLPTLYDTSGGLWFGTGGASVGVSGSSIWQWEAAAGLTVKFGGK